MSRKFLGIGRGPQDAAALMEAVSREIEQLRRDFNFHKHNDTSSQALKGLRIPEYDTDLPNPPAGSIWIFNDAGTYKLSYRTRAGTTKRVTLT